MVCFRNTAGGCCPDVCAFEGFHFYTHTAFHGEMWWAFSDKAGLFFLSLPVLACSVSSAKWNEAFVTNFFPQKECFIDSWNMHVPWVVRFYQASWINYSILCKILAVCSSAENTDMCPLRKLKRLNQLELCSDFLHHLLGNICEWSGAMNSLLKYGFPENQPNQLIRNLSGSRVLTSMLCHFSTNFLTDDGKASTPSDWRQSTETLMEWKGAW